MGKRYDLNAQREPMPPKLKADVKSVRVPLMVPETWLEPVEEWRREQPKIPTRAEAIRRLVEIALQIELEKKARLTKE